MPITREIISKKWGKSLPNFVSQTCEDVLHNYF